MRILLAAFGLVMAAPAAGQGSAAAAPEAEAPASVDYAADANWLCLPGREDACGRPIPTAALNPNGYGSVGRSVPAADPPIDCFYVYPTVSRDPGDNSDLVPGIDEQAAVAVQFARFSTVCRPFAPIYRQATLTSLLRAFAGAPLPRNMELPYQDLRDAWHHYLEHHNQGRPFVLVGHSQGTVHLARLLATEIEGSEVAERMVSALLLGFNIEVPVGSDVGGTFARTPLCREPGQTGCVVTWVSFRATNPPPEGALFGRTTRPGMTVGCTNPAALAGGTAPLDSYWYAGPSTTSAADPVDWSSEGDPPTPFLRTEGLATGTCVNREGLGYLAVGIDADPDDARTDRVPGDVVVAGRPQPGWGLHLVDMNLAMGDLLALVEAQRDAWLRDR